MERSWKQNKGLCWGGSSDKKQPVFLANRVTEIMEPTTLDH